MSNWIRAWIDRQFRMTFRTVYAALIARREPGTPEQVAKLATRYVDAALAEYAKERREKH